MSTNSKLPTAAQQIAQYHPDVWDAYEQLGKAVAEAGPLDARTIHLVKIAAAIAQRSEGATHSHVRRALEAGVSAAEIRHVSMLLAPTSGFPQAVAGRTWIEDILAEQDT
ncbi:carboxymuconolactone decarboxylase family protein [Rhodovibrio salinarum]|uniref:Carboxymuconolactone decarboxylase family protein n=1 Tax=Rhodovibrio salinarum TaxID=1087 RepID=A0A934UZ05_9PROT|nr:carboxymuconolactone decarboxylase family protein [Rhodovibrio salinarum]MBK1696582.1 carboxymuconolactone decarboxylase family protein [Rhodovibrio salinarum]